MEPLLNDIRYALRNLFRRSGFTLVNVIPLAPMALTTELISRGNLSYNFIGRLKPGVSILLGAFCVVSVWLLAAPCYLPARPAKKARPLEALRFT